MKKKRGKGTGEGVGGRERGETETRRYMRDGYAVSGVGGWGFRIREGDASD